MRGTSKHKQANAARVQLEFCALTNIMVYHPTNRIEDNNIRKDNMFFDLSEKAFENPRLLDILAKKVEKWRVLDDSEWVYALGGYVYYCRYQYRQAEKYFLKAINKNPHNLDNWFDLAFSLYHQDHSRHILAKKILFHFDFCVSNFTETRVTLTVLRRALITHHSCKRPSLKAVRT